MKNLKRILALVLTVLMVVGVLPMAIFAVGPDNAAPTDEYRINDSVAEFLSAAYNADSQYWKQIFTSEGISAKYGYTSRTTVSDLFGSGTYIEMDPTDAGTIPVTETGDVLSLPQDTSKTAATWGGAAKGGGPWITNAGVRHNGEAIKNNLWAKNLAGVDTVVTFKVQMNSASGVGAAGIFTGVQSNQNNANQGYPCILSIHHDEAGVFTLRLSSNGAILATLDTSKFNTISIVYDVGGETRAEAVANYYVYVDGEYVGAGAFATSTQLDSLYAAQIANNEANGTTTITVSPSSTSPLTLPRYFTT